MPSRRRNSFVTGRVVAFAGGAAAGALASRLLPPVAAMAGGSARAAAGGDPLAPLAADHRRFEDLLDQMVHSRNDAPLRRVQLLLRLKRGLAAHAMAEEDVLYPLLDGVAGTGSEVRRLYGEHAEMKMSLYRLEKLPKESPVWASEAHRLQDLIVPHARREEEVEFPRVRDALDARGRTRLARDLLREKALVL